MGFGLSSAAAYSVSMGELVGGALDSGADRVAGLPLGRLLFGADAQLQVAEFSRRKAHVPGRGAGAPGPVRTRLALALGEPGHDQGCAGGLGGRVRAVPAGADLAVRAGDLLAVEADVKIVPAEALAQAVLAGGVDRQRSADGDLMFACGSFQVDQRGVAAVDQVLGGQQPTPRQPSVEAGQHLGVARGGRGGGHIRDHIDAAGSARLGEVGGEPLPADDVPMADVASGGVVERRSLLMRAAARRPRRCASASGLPHHGSSSAP